MPQTHKQATDELAELQAGFDLRWNADMRAIKKWQEATGKTLVWSDHADLCVWLMGQLDALGGLETKKRNRPEL